MSTYLCFCLEKEQSGYLFPVQFCFLFPVQSCSQLIAAPANSKHKNLISGHSNWCDAAWCIEYTNRQTNLHPDTHPKIGGCAASPK